MIQHIQILLAYLSPIFGFVGTVLIFFFGVPRQIDTGGLQYYVSGEKNEFEIKKIKKYKCWGTIGLILIALGFLISILILILQNYIGH
jgi:hypothetical protein